MTRSFSNIQRLATPAVMTKLDTGHNPPLANVQHVRAVSQSVQPLTDDPSTFGDVIQQTVLLEQVKASKGRGTTQGIARVSMAVQERTLRGQLTTKGPFDLVGGQRGGKGQVSGGNALGQAKEIWAYMLVLTGEHAACPTEPRRDLIRNQQRVVLACQVSDPAQKARGLTNNPCRTLYERFDDNRRDFVGMLFEQFLELAQALRP